MPLHHKIAAGLQFAARLPRVNELSPEAARVQLRELWMGIPKRVPPPSLAVVEDRVIATGQGELRLRAYTPEGPAPLPIVHFIHGGGFVAGDLESYDDLCRRIAALSQAIVIAPDYRLAPDYRYPTAIDDCTATILWSYDNAASLGGDRDRIAVAGDSAGGNIATMVALRLRDCGILRAQLLMYPVTDHYSSDFASYSDCAEGYGLTAGEMRWFWDLYLDADDPASAGAASPLRAEDLARLPPTLVVSAEYDVLRDEGERYVARLAAAGTDVQGRRASGMNHGFYMLAGALREADKDLADVCGWLRTTLAGAA